MCTLMTRTEADRAREIIESALREHQVCGDCGQPMGIVEHGDELWIECASLRTRRGFWHAFSEAFHERHPLDLPVGEVSLAA